MHGNTLKGGLFLMLNSSQSVIFVDQRSIYITVLLVTVNMDKMFQIAKDYLIVCLHTIIFH